MIAKDEVNFPVENEVSKEQIDVGAILGKYIYHWPVFVIGILLCVSAAFLYLRYVQPIYLVSTSLLIKDETKGGMKAQGDLLNELDIFGSSKVVDNEIEILKSRALMLKVVERLNLSTSFHANGRVKSADLYSTKPVDLKTNMINSVWLGRSLVLSFPTRNTYQLKEESTSRTFSGPLNTLQSNELGSYSLNRNTSRLSKTGSSIIVTFEDPNSVVDRLLSAMTISIAGKQSSVLSLTMETSVPQKGVDVLNTLVQVYNEEALFDKNRTTQSTIDFIDERLKLITGELTEVEKDVEGFKSSRGLTDISSDANAYLENVRVNDAKLNEINIQISVIKDILRYVNSSSSQEKLPSTLGLEDPVLLTQINQLADLRLQRDELLATTTDSNPLLSPLVSKIETTRSGIRSTITNILQTLLVSKRDLERNSSTFQNTIKKMPGQERQLISIKRQQTIKESLYLYLLQKKEEAALSYASAVADTRIVDSAFWKRTPLKPNRPITYLGSLLIGLTLAAGYIFSKDLLNNRVNGKMSLATITGAPVLGEIIFNENTEPIVVNESSRKIIAEQFRAIRTNMQFLKSKADLGQGRVTLFTSSMSGEGKTFVGTNIAAAFAISGKKTVLLELDLRKPKVSQYLGLENRTGLSNYLVGDEEIRNIIKPLEFHENLSVIGSGPIPPNPSEILDHSRLEDLIIYLRRNFDEIIIDAPPIGLVTDAQIISRVCDLTFYIVREGVTFKNQISNLETLYRNKRFPQLNVILNGIKQNSSGYGYGHGYYDERIQNTSTIKEAFNNLLRRF